MPSLATTKTLTEGFQAGAVEVLHDASATVVLLDQSSESGRRMHRFMAGMGVLGRDIRYAEGGVRMALATYRRKQVIFRKGWNMACDGALPAWRDRVREKVAKVRSLRRLAAGA